MGDVKNERHGQARHGHSRRNELHHMDVGIPEVMVQRKYQRVYRRLGGAVARDSGRGEGGERGGYGDDERVTAFLL